MLIRNIIESELEINSSLLSDNNIDFNKLEFEGYYPNEENVERFLTLLLLMEKRDKDNYQLKSYIFYAYLVKKDYNKAVIYLDKLYNGSYYKKDVLTYILLLEGILKTKVIIPDKIDIRDILLNNRDAAHNDIDLQNSIRKSIYNKCYKAAKFKFKGFYVINNLGINEKIIELLLKINVRLENQAIIDKIEELDFDYLDNYYNNEKHPVLKDITKLQMELLELLYQVNEGYILPDPEPLPKKYDIYHAFRTYHIDLIANITTNDIVKKFAEKIISVNQKNIEASYNNNLNIYLDSAIEDIYRDISLGYIHDAKNRLVDYLVFIHRGYFSHLALNLFDRVLSNIKYGDAESSDDYLAELMDFLVDISRPHSPNNLRHLKNNLAIDLGEKHNQEYDEQVCNLDIEYNYGISHDIINSIHKQLRKQDFDISSLTTLTSDLEDQAYILAIAARICYRKSLFEKGDEILTCLKTNYADLLNHNKELTLFINAISARRETIQNIEPMTLAENVKRLILG
ncbi:MAG: hypothetical protein J1F35_01980 [Erysipelotrichales bacterium]|nr:hypothetical protein [Erysipelotrichales bacterium]